MYNRLQRVFFCCLLPLTVWMGCRSHDAALMVAVRNEEVGNVKRLLEEGAQADVVSAGESAFPLEVAAVAGNAEIVRLLLEHDAVPDSFRGADAPLWAALLHDHEAAATLLVDAGATIDLPMRKGMSTFYCAVMLDYAELVSKMVAHEADIHAPGPQGSPLHEAAENGNLALVKLLVANGADLNRINDLGETPIFLAAERHHFEVLQWLVDKGADASAANGLGNTILHEFAAAHDTLAISQVCAMTINPDVQNRIGETPLHIAAAKGDLEAAILLIDQCHADLNLVEIHGLSPAGVAFREGETEMVELLTARGGRLR